MGASSTKQNNKSLQKENPKNIKEELGLGNKPVPLSVAIKLSKSICKITLQNDESKNVYGTGFFIELNSSKFLISIYHIINEKIKNKRIEIEI